MNSIRIKFDEKKERRTASLEELLIPSFFAVLALGFILAFILPLRPSVSQSEKRKLTAFPQFSMQSLFSGSYFEGIDLWFSDTFPLREQMVSANSDLKKLYGINTVQISGDVEKGDDIPDAPTRPPAPVITTAPPAETTVEQTTEKPAEPIKTQELNSVLLAGDQAYEYYTFVRKTADRYAAEISKAAAKLKGISTVYDMIVPTGIGIIIPDSLRNSINSSDQNKAIKYMYGSMSETVKTVSIYDTLMAHKAEYIYFRTDHHWTALGAYYGYEQLAKAKGFRAIPLSKYQKVSFKGFLGSFYSETDKNPALTKHPDTVDAYKPFNNTLMKYTDSKGKVIPWSVITDVSDWSAGTKYNAFIGGDNSYTVISNQETAGNASCIVVKESFGNALIPFLVAHYKTIHVIDYRYWDGDLAAFAKAKKAKDVFFINNISATRNESLVSRMEDLTD